MAVWYIYIYSGPAPAGKYGRDTSDAAAAEPHLTHEGLTAAPSNSYAVHAGGREGLGRCHTTRM